MEPKGINIQGLIPPQNQVVRTDKKEEPPVRPVQGTKGSQLSGVENQRVQGQGEARAISITEEDAQNATEILKEELKDIPGIEVDWKFNRDAGVLVVQVKDKETGRVLREIPPEELIKILEGGTGQGIIIDKKA